MPPRSVGPATPPSDAGSPQTTAAAAVRGPQQEMQTGTRRSGSEPRRDQSQQSPPHGCAGMSSSSGMAVLGVGSAPTAWASAIERILLGLRPPPPTHRASLRARPQGALAKEDHGGPFERAIDRRWPGRPAEHFAFVPTNGPDASSMPTVFLRCPGVHGETYSRCRLRGARGERRYPFYSLAGTRMVELATAPWPRINPPVPLSRSCGRGCCRPRTSPASSNCRRTPCACWCRTASGIAPFGRSWD